jgi:phage baseplate assembly protein gpV
MLAYFFKDPLVKWTLTGKDLSTLLEGIYSKVNTFDPKTPKKMADDVYLHFSKGIKITYDRSPAAKNGSRLKQVLIGGKPLQADVKYTVGMTEWIVLGKEDLYMAVDKTKYKAFSNVVEAMTNYFLKHKKVTVAYEGRQVDSGKYPKQ